MDLDHFTQITCLPNATSSENPDPSEKFAYIAGFSSTGFSSQANVMSNSRMDLLNTTLCENIQKTRTKNWRTNICAGILNIFKNLFFAFFKKRIFISR